MFVDPSQDVESIANNVFFNIIVTVTEAKTNSSKELFSKKPDKSVSVFDLEINIYNLHPQGDGKFMHEHSFIAMTSGSTGEPKLVQVPIQCIQPNISDLTRMFNITSQDIIYFSTPLTFDPSMIEILLACVNGASLLIAPENPDILFSKDKNNSITFWQTTPSKFFQQSNANIKSKILSPNSTLKILALGGEPLNGIKRLRELKCPNNNTKIFTLYGVTEMSCWACAAELDLNRIITDKEVPLGACLSETQLIIEPESKKKSNSGTIALMSKSRKCVILNKANGSEQESSLKFIDTGDLGEIKNGTVYYRGRKDDIVKRFGHKINLQSIENTVMLCPMIKTCSCVWLPKPMLLVIYFSSESFSSQELSDFLKCKLDEKHWPDKIVRVDDLPMNSHGKISKHLLSKMFERVLNIPKTIDSLKLCFLKELQQVLGRKLTYDDIKNKDFFSIGGTSFVAVAMCNKMAASYPEFAKFILPYLMGQKNTIDEIMILAHKELFDNKPKKRMKRARSNADSVSEVRRLKRPSVDSSIPIEFVVLWTYDTKKCVDASPTLFQMDFNLFVIVGSHSGKVLVANAISGDVEGIVAVKARVEASVFCYQENAESPPCGVVGAYDGTIVCFTLENSKEIWRINIKSMIKSKATYCDGLFYIAAYDGKIRCINVKTGEIKYIIDIADQAISADLVLAKNEYVLLGTLSGVCASLQTATKSVAWRGVLSSPVFASPVLYDHDKYVLFAEVNGEIHCRTVEKGIKIWKYQGAKGNIFSSIYVKRLDTLKWQMVFGCHDNQVYSINIKNFQPSLHWKTQMSSPVYSTPCGLGNKFILAASNNGELSVLDAENGTILGEYQLPNETFSSPAVFGDYIFIGCRNDHVFSLKYVLNL